jgi:hypothetical protein
MLLGIKTTKRGFHIYKHGEHKHNNNNGLAQRSKLEK